jgi:hypothetical protein
MLLARHSLSNSEALGLLSHVIVAKVAHHMLPQFSLSRSLCSREAILLSIAYSLSERRVVPDVNRQSSRHHDFTGGKEEYEDA